MCRDRLTAQTNYLVVKKMNIKLNIDPQVVNLEKLFHALEQLKELNVLSEDNHIVCAPELNSQVNKILESIIKN